MSIRALIVYHGGIDKWLMVAAEFGLNHLLMSPERFMSGLTEEWRGVILAARIVEVSSLEASHEEQSWTWTHIEEYDIPPLEQRIQNNAAFLRKWLTENKVRICSKQR